MTKQLLCTLIAICLVTGFVKPLNTALAAEAVEIPIAQNDVFYTINSQRIDRVKILSDFFKSFDGPLEPYSAAFVRIADKYELDYRLLPSIACLESSCGKFYIKSSNNPFGWGIYGNTVTSFKTVEECIEAVAKGLSTNYVAKGYETVEEIAVIYNPSNSVKWAGNVRYFYNKIN